jgi:hypothetical protein
MIGFMVGTCVAFFVVIGDLAPPIVANLFSVPSTDELRMWILIGTNSKRARNNFFCAHATSRDALTFLIIITYRYVSIATLLTLTTEHRGCCHRPRYKSESKQY